MYPELEPRFIQKRKQRRAISINAIFDTPVTTRYLRIYYYASNNILLPDNALEIFNGFNDKILAPTSDDNIYEIMTLTSKNNYCETYLKFYCVVSDFSKKQRAEFDGIVQGIKNEALLTRSADHEKIKGRDAYLVSYNCNSFEEDRINIYKVRPKKVDYGKLCFDEENKGLNYVQQIIINR